MLVVLEFSAVLEGIYASSAIATLNRACSTSLLHPGHADALKRIVRQASMAYVGAAPTNVVLSLVDVNDSRCVFTVDDGHESAVVSEFLLHAVTAISVGIIGSAAGLLDFGRIPRELYEPFVPAWKCGEIEPGR